MEIHLVQLRLVKRVYTKTVFSCTRLHVVHTLYLHFFAHEESSVLCESRRERVTQSNGTEKWGEEERESESLKRTSRRKEGNIVCWSLDKKTLLTLVSSVVCESRGGGDGEADGG